MHLNALLFLGLLAGLAMALCLFQISNPFQSSARAWHWCWRRLALGLLPRLQRAIGQGRHHGRQFLHPPRRQRDAQRRAKAFIPKEIHTPSVEDNQVAFLNIMLQRENV